MGSFIMDMNLNKKRSKQLVNSIDISVSAVKFRLMTYLMTSLQRYICFNGLADGK